MMLKTVLALFIFLHSVPFETYSSVAPSWQGCPSPPSPFWDQFDDEDECT